MLFPWSADIAHYFRIGTSFLSIIWKSLNSENWKARCHNHDALQRPLSHGDTIKKNSVWTGSGTPRAGDEPDGTLRFNLHWRATITPWPARRDYLLSSILGVLKLNLMNMISWYIQWPFPFSRQTARRREFRRRHYIPHPPPLATDCYAGQPNFSIARLTPGMNDSFMATGNPSTSTYTRLVFSFLFQVLGALS